MNRPKPKRSKHLFARNRYGTSDRKRVCGKSWIDSFGEKNETAEEPNRDEKGDQPPPP